MSVRYKAGVETLGGTTSGSEPLREWLLRWFPERAHPLTLVHDPDDLLADEVVLAALAVRGFRLVSEVDSIALRCQIEAARPWSPERPVVVRTAGRLADLPYDLWYAGHRVELGLNAFFRHLDYPTVRQLGAKARARLSSAPSPDRPLGPGSTVGFLLRHAYGADMSLLRTPAALLIWLADYHALWEPMPAALAERLARELKTERVFAAWDLDALLSDPEVLPSFLAREWSAYLAKPRSAPLGESVAGYAIDFGQDAAMQGAISRLVRAGALAPIEVPESSVLPGWARPAIRVAGAAEAIERFEMLARILDEALRGDLRSASWSVWRDVARSWASLQTIGDSSSVALSDEQRAAQGRLRSAIDAQFAAWLPSHYSGLATLGVPPHHVWHVPGFMAYEWRTRPVERVALVIVDGMALRDWAVVAPVWKQRHPGWAMREDVLLAQAPTITSVSRQALVNGLRPAQFAESLSTNRFEAKQWAAFWAREEPPLPESACVYGRLDGAGGGAAFGSRAQAVCLVTSGIDDIVHGATLGAADVQASLHLWLSSESHALERDIAGLLAQGFRVYVASDHGHVEAIGIGGPSDGVAAETRGKRARIYRDRAVAERANGRFPDTDIWADDSLLPSDVFVLLPRARTAFATAGELVVTHGGATLDEMVVPFVTIEDEKRG